MTDDTAPTGFDHTGASPWPVVIALGFALSELGIVFGLRPVSVAGLLLFVGATTGILRESGHVAQGAHVAGGLGVVLVLIGVALILTTQQGTTVRGQSILIAGTVSIVAAIGWHSVARERLHGPPSEQEAAQSDHREPTE